MKILLIHYVFYERPEKPFKTLWDDDERILNFDYFELIAVDKSVIE